MKIEDMILVIENTKGKEKNMLMTPEDYKKKYLFVASLSREEAATMLKELFDTKQPKAGWAELYMTANHSFYAKFCNDCQELQSFLCGSYNDDSGFQFDKEQSSSECMQALEEYNLDVTGGLKGSMFHYELKKQDFRQGDILHNFNGTDYRVMEKYTEKNLLLMNLSSGSLVVALDTDYFARYPKNGEQTEENAEYGIEWGHGVYLSAVPSEIDFRSLRTEYGSVEKSQDGTFDIEVRETLSRVKSVPADCLGDALDEVMEQYRSGELILDADDFQGVDYIPVTDRQKK